MRLGHHGYRLDGDFAWLERWHLSLLLREWTLAEGYTTRDFRNFDLAFEQSASERAATPVVSPPHAAPAALASGTSATAAAPEALRGKPEPLSVHAASVEELAKLPGLSLKIAKEIVKGRAYASVNALLRVRGIGEKSLRRLKSLLTL